MIRDLKEAENVEICFLVDCTGSMETYIEKVKTVVKDATKVLFQQFRHLKFRCSFIGYGDYNKDGTETKDQIIIFPFTKNTEEFKKYVDGVKIRGGGDACEVNELL